MTKNVKIIIAGIGLIICGCIGWFGFSYYKLEKKVTDLNSLAMEQVAVELGATTTPTTDFVRAVYMADVQINQVLQAQQK